MNLGPQECAAKDLKGNQCFRFVGHEGAHMANSGSNLVVAWPVGVSASSGSDQ